MAGLAGLFGRGQQQAPQEQLLDLTKPMLKEGGIFAIAFESAVGIIEKGKDLLGSAKGGEVTSSEVAGTAVAKEGIMARVVNFLSPQAPEIEEPVKLGRSADLHMGKIAEPDAYHNTVVVPQTQFALAPSQGMGASV